MPHYSSPTSGRLREPIRQPVRAHVFKRDDFTCQYCGDEAIEIDHIIPIAAGGDHLPGNLVAACRFCNAVAHDKLFTSFEEKQAYLLTFTERRVKRVRRNLTLCADCGVVYEYRQYGSTRVLCAECYRIDVNGASLKDRARQRRMQDLNARVIRDAVTHRPPKR